MERIIKYGGKLFFGSLIISFNNTGSDNIMKEARFSSCYKSNTTQLKKDREKFCERK